MEEALRARVESRKRRVIHAAGQDDPLTRRACVLQRAREERGQLSEIADDDEKEVRMRRGDTGERREESFHVLPWIELADIQNVPSGHPKSCCHAPSLFSSGRGEVGVDRLRDHRHTIGRDVQQVDDVAPSGFRHRDDRVSASRERVLPRMTEPRVRQTKVVLRPAQWREVVDRDHCATRAKRRQAELRRVIDARARDRKLGRQ